MFRMQGLLLSILIAAGNVSFGNAATVRPMHEWSYEQGADYYLLQYLHEAWDFGHFERADMPLLVAYCNATAQEQLLLFCYTY